MNPFWQYKEKDFHFYTYPERPNFPFYEVRQVHGTHIINTPPFPQEILEADGILYRGEEECSLAIKTADCLAVAFLGEEGVAHIHAGWRGLRKGILINTQITSLKPYKAIIAPAIQAQFYEVGEEFMEIFSDYPTCLNKNDQKLTFDLPQACEIQLKKHYHRCDIINCNLDTYSNRELNSYRRDQTTRRNYNVLKVMRKI